MAKKAAACLLIAALFSVLIVSQAKADEEDMKIIFKDAIYGGLIGFVVGGALLLFDPAPDNLKLLGYGAGAGTIAGTAYGIFTTATPLMEYKEGNLYIGAPSLKARVRDYKNITIMSEMFRFNF